MRTLIFLVTMGPSGRREWIFQKVETVNFEMTDSGFARPASASLQFRCVSDSEPK